MKSMALKFVIIPFNLFVLRQMKCPLKNMELLKTDNEIRNVCYKINMFFLMWIILIVLLITQM